MMHIHDKIHKLVSFSFMSTVGLTLLASTIKISYIVGSFFSFFSINNSVAPLAGAFGGTLGSCLLSFIRLANKFYATGYLTPKLLMLQLPTLGAGLYWASPSFLVRILIPLVCMILFCAHPIGGQAWVYSLPWFIPIMLYFVPQKSIFLASLGSTYTAHAIGSVVWLYSINMAPAAWMGLIPVALAERIFFAMGMTTAYYAINGLEQTYSPKIMHLFKRIKYSLSS